MESIMKRRLFVILALVVFFIPVSVSLADTGLDDQGNPNDPAVNARANACYPGGAMEGKCDTEWEWTCGWYLIRYNAGMYSRSQVPATCASLLPPVLKGAKTYPTVGCVLLTPFDISGPVYLNFNGGNYLPAPVTVYNDANCSIVNRTFVTPIAYAPGGAADALAICQQHGHSSAVQQLGSEPYIYECS
jgi:hypothetical protein